MIFYALPALVYSHAILTTQNLVTRVGPDQSGETSGVGNKVPQATSNGPPITVAQLKACGNSKPGPIGGTLPAGGQYTLSWTITLPHPSDPGVRVALKYPGDADFTILADGVNVNDKQATVQIPQRTGPATLQWLWASADDGGYYMACADVNVR